MKSPNTPDSPKPAPLTYNVGEAAIALGISKPSVYRLLARQILHSIPYLRHKRIARIEVEKLSEGGHYRA